jgi:hypothetical protein
MATDSPVSNECSYPISGRVWFRQSTQEWVLELTGVIDGTDFVCRHTAPSSVASADVPGLPHLYSPADTADDLWQEAFEWAQEHVKNAARFSTTEVRTRAQEAYIAGASRSLSGKTEGES